LDDEALDDQQIVSQFPPSQLHLFRGLEKVGHDALEGIRDVLQEISRVLEPQEIHDALEGIHGVRQLQKISHDALEGIRDVLQKISRVLEEIHGVLQKISRVLEEIHGV
jgi:hypothetical protein